MKQLKDLRRELKKIGFKIKTETLSIGRIACIADNSSDMPTIMSRDQYSYWLPAIECADSYQRNLYQNDEKIIFNYYVQISISA